MKVTGKIKAVHETQTFGEKGFRKRELVVTTEEQYPQHILVEFVQDKCDLLNNFKVGNNVEVSINLRGREWINPQGETKYFNTIQGWQITSQDDNGNVQPQKQDHPGTPFEMIPEGLTNQDSDDMPF